MHPVATTHSRLRVDTASFPTPGSRMAFNQRGRIAARSKMNAVEPDRAEARHMHLCMALAVPAEDATAERPPVSGSDEDLRRDLFAAQSALRRPRLSTNPLHLES